MSFVILSNISVEYFRRIIVPNNEQIKNIIMYYEHFSGIFIFTLSSSFLAACISKMRLLLRIAIFSLFSNNFLGLGGLLCLLVFGSPNAFLLHNTIPLPTSLSLSSVVSL